MSKALSIRPSEFLDPYFEEDAITRFAIDLVVLVSDIEQETEIPNIEDQTDSLRKRDLEFKRKYNITLEQAKKIVFGDTDGSGRG
ncbi:hypothetical protein DRO37_07700 [Candidatus Bathyarchaeota archaeon]|nr:MAG: hypothetical protein DRO37_07700 [Candidatus Bathyarchaeota archaeon]